MGGKERRKRRGDVSRDPLGSDGARETAQSRTVLRVVTHRGARLEGSQLSRRQRDIGYQISGAHLTDDRTALERATTS